MSLTFEGVEVEYELERVERADEKLDELDDEEGLEAVAFLRSLRVLLTREEGQLADSSP